MIGSSPRQEEPMTNPIDLLDTLIMGSTEEE